MAGIAHDGDDVIIDWRKKTGPAGSTVIFARAIEQYRAAPGAGILPLCLMDVELPTKGSFGPMFPQDMILFRGQFFAPFGIGQFFLHRA